MRRHRCVMAEWISGESVGNDRHLDAFAVVRHELIHDAANVALREQGMDPIYTAGAAARVAVIGQAPGRRAQASGVPWDDASGVTLMQWLGVTEGQFRDPDKFALLPMDFYYPGPGRGGSGDAPPRRGFAARWHPPLFALMPNIRLTLLIGRYAQQAYLPIARAETLTDTVRRYEQFLPERFPLVHPSPLNFRWHARNPWFAAEVVEDLRRHIETALR
ncbi:uracil-DNA glycosylase family protein [Microbacterium sp. Root280D1]|uniref:uracil-DNA glycosylase family protein n=2 Tax=unclassified Microbacterium TaxID=2609290 RepID=UPI002AA2A538|nr:uracil-DNA glycosylase family protein [Microbacterium sp. Root280D1]